MCTYARIRNGFEQNIDTVVTANCSVDLLTYSAGVLCSQLKQPRVAYVKLNGDTIWQGSFCGNGSNPRGVNTLLVDPFACSVLQSRRFDTHSSSTDAAHLRDYIRRLNRGSVIIGVTADEPRSSLGFALSALREIGVDVDDVRYRGSFAFIAQKGYRAKTVLSKVVGETESNKAPASVSAVITGAVYK